jgi:hypothetical protein
MGLTIMHGGPLQWHNLPTTLYENLHIGSKVIGGGGSTDKQTDYLISLISFFESRLINIRVPTKPIIVLYYIPFNNT